MRSNSATINQLAVLLGVAAVMCQCTGCAPSGADAIKFAKEHMSKLAEPKTVQGDNGKWHSEAMDVRKANPGFKEDGEIQAWANYEFRMLRSAEFDTEAAAKDADLSPVDEKWQSKEELFIHKDGEWKLSE